MAEGQNGKTDKAATEGQNGKTDKVTITSTRLPDETGGSYWDDGLYGKVKAINLRLDTYIHSISVDYEKENENIISSKWRGSQNGQLIDPITLAPEEHIKTVSGNIGEVKLPNSNTKVKVIRLIKFETNLGTYGPFGDSSGEYETFSYSVKDGDNIIGFFGRCSSQCLNAIGFHATKA